MYQWVLRMFTAQKLSVLGCLSAISLMSFAVALPVGVEAKPGATQPAQKSEAKKVDAAANTADEKKSAPGATANPSGADDDDRDYYTRRAKEMLKEDAAHDFRPHPLMKNYPEQFVTVCEGGCRNRQACIVDLEPRKPAKMETIGEMIPTAAGGDANLANVAQCIGGCPGQASGDEISGLPSEADWESLSRAAPAPQSGSESGRWLTQ